MISCQSLSKQYGQLIAVSGLDLELRQGQIVGLIGPNAAGKTTAINMIGGLTPPSEGKVLVNGRPLVEHERPATVLATVLDVGSAPGSVTVREFLRQVSLVAGTGRASLQETMDILGLFPIERTRFRDCSLGSRRRVMLAAALLGRPQYLLLDEPLNGLDPNTVRWLTGFLRALAHEHGVGILLSSHLLDEQSHACDELFIMGSGSVLASGPLEGLINRYRDHTVMVATTAGRAGELAQFLTSGGWPTLRGEDCCEVRTTSVERLGRELFDAGFPMTRFHIEAPSLQEVYFAVTSGHQGLRSSASAKGDFAP